MASIWLQESTFARAFFIITSQSIERISLKQDRVTDFIDSTSLPMSWYTLEFLWYSWHFASWNLSSISLEWISFSWFQTGDAWMHSEIFLQIPLAIFKDSSRQTGSFTDFFLGEHTLLLRKILNNETIVKPRDILWPDSDFYWNRLSKKRCLLLLAYE